MFDFREGDFFLQIFSDDFCFLHLNLKTTILVQIIYFLFLISMHLLVCLIFLQ